MSVSSPSSRARQALLVLAALSFACGLPQPLPPAIEIAGLVTNAEQSGDTIVYRFRDGRSLEVSTRDRALLTQSWFGDLVVAGADARGRFVATYMTQDGLPADCYVDNSMGTDRGPYIELRGVLWVKAEEFVPAEPVERGSPYPASTRFCFNQRAEITRTVAP